VRLPGSDENCNLYSRLGGYASIADTPDAVEPADVGRFATAYAEAALVGAAHQQLESFINSAVKCLPIGPASAFSLCSSDDVELLVCGSPDVGHLSELEESCVYADGFSPDSQPVCLFWQVVHRFSEAERRKLLLFCTGTDRVPILGLKALGFIISRSSAELDHLPTANTCVNRLNLPEYTSDQMMQDRLYAALEHNVGFGFA